MRHAGQARAWLREQTIPEGALRRRHTEISIETRRVIVLRHGAATTLVRCPHCRGEVRMVSVEQAARLTEVSERTIYRWVDNDLLHYAESPAGHLLICVESLAKTGPER